MPSPFRIWATSDRPVGVDVDCDVALTDKQRERSLAMERTLSACKFYEWAKAARRQRASSFIHIIRVSAGRESASKRAQRHSKSVAQANCRRESRRERLAQCKLTMEHADVRHGALSLHAYSMRVWEQCHTLSPSLTRRPIADEWARESTHKRAQAQESLILLSAFTVRACTVRRHSFVSLHFILFRSFQKRNSISIFCFLFSVQLRFVSVGVQTADGYGGRNCSKLLRIYRWLCPDKPQHKTHTKRALSSEVNWNLFVELSRYHSSRGIIALNRNENNSLPPHKRIINTNTNNPTRLRIGIEMRGIRWL